MVHGPGGEVEAAKYERLTPDLLNFPPKYCKVGGDTHPAGIATNSTIATNNSA